MRYRVPSGHEAFQVKMTCQQNDLTLFLVFFFHSAAVSCLFSMYGDVCTIARPIARLTKGTVTGGFVHPDEGLSRKRLPSQSFFFSHFKGSRCKMVRDIRLFSLYIFSRTAGPVTGKESFLQGTCTPPVSPPPCLRTFQWLSKEDMKDKKLCVVVTSARKKRGILGHEILTT